MLNFLVVGDWGRRGCVEQRAVACGLARAARRDGSRFVLSTGDNFYDDGVQSVDDPHWRESFEYVYADAALDLPWYVALGNHDYNGNVRAQLHYTAQSRRWYLPRRYYGLNVTIAPGVYAQLVVLDTTPLLPMYRAGGAEHKPETDGEDANLQIRWLRHMLAPATSRWRLVMGHHPLYSGSPFHGGDGTLQRRVGPALRDYGVQAYFCGHEHDLQHLEVGGVQHVISGAGSETRITGATDGTRFCASTLGFVSVTLTPEAMHLTYCAADAAPLYRASVPANAAVVPAA
jgi:acid phosphatase